MLNIQMTFLAQLPQVLDIDGLILDIRSGSAKGKPGEGFIQKGGLQHNDFGEMEEVLNGQHLHNFFEVIVSIAIGERVDIDDPKGILRP